MLISACTPDAKFHPSIHAGAIAMPTSDTKDSRPKTTRPRHSLSWAWTAGAAYSTRTSSSQALSSQSHRSSRTGCQRGSSAPSTAGTGVSRPRCASTSARSAGQAARGSPTRGACLGTRRWFSAHASRLVWATSSTQTRHSVSCWPNKATRKHKATWSRHGQPIGPGGGPRACGT